MDTDARITYYRFVWIKFNKVKAADIYRVSQKINDKLHIPGRILDRKLTSRFDRENVVLRAPANRITAKNVSGQNSVLSSTQDFLT